MTEKNSERLEARLNEIIEKQEQIAQSLRKELDNTRRAVEREADAAKEINNSAHRVLQTTEKHLSEQINRYTRFASWVGALLAALFAIFAFMGIRDFNAAVTKTLAPFITAKKMTPCSESGARAFWPRLKQRSKERWRRLKPR